MNEIWCVVFHSIIAYLSSYEHCDGYFLSKTDILFVE